MQLVVRYLISCDSLMTVYVIIRSSASMLANGDGGASKVRRMWEGNKTPCRSLCLDL